MDLVVVEAQPFGTGRDRRAEAVRLWRALAVFDVLTDLLVYSRDEVAYWRDSRNHVLARALREGKVLYRAIISRPTCSWLWQNGILPLFAT